VLAALLIVAVFAVVVVPACVLAVVKDGSPFKASFWTAADKEII
jgi:hypothetical protein